MKYDIEQFPKNKNINGLSDDQKNIRSNKKYIEYETKSCKKCNKELPINEFYPKYYKGTRDIQRRDGTCRDCRIKAMGVVEVGKTRFAKKIFKNGFRRCFTCKDIKPLIEFTKNKNEFGGYSHTCYQCSKKIVREYCHKQNEQIGYFYVRQYALKNHNVDINNVPNSLEKYRNEIIENKKDKYFIDGESFFTLQNFAIYIKGKYGNPITTTLKRINEGRTENECKIPETQMRTLRSGTNKGKIRVTDTVTKDEFEFFNTKDAELLKMFGSSSISEGIKTGLPIGGKRSKYKNPCLIERISK